MFYCYVLYPKIIKEKVMNIEISSQALWDSWQFARFNSRGIQDSCALLEAERSKKRLYYQIDFSDLHSFLFPKRAKDEIDSDDLALHSRSVKFLWESILKENPTQVPFKILLNPGTRLEAIEALWHAEQRVRGGFARYLSEFPDIFDQNGRFNANDTSVLSNILEKLNHHTFLPLLQRIVSDETLSEEIRKPTESLMALFSNGWIHNIEDCISNDILDKIIKKRVSDRMVLDDIENFFRRNNRNTELSFEHKNFHDSIDALNLCFSYDLYSCPEAKDFYAPLLTHTLRVISAAENIKKLHGNNQIIHISVAALYYIRALQVKQNNMERFLLTGKSLIEDITEQLAGIKSLANILSLPISERQKIFNKESFTSIPKRLFNKLKFFAEEYYEIVDIGDILDYTDNPQAKLNAQSITKIDDFVEILNRRDKTIEEVRRSARVLREKLGYLDGGLAGLYIPREGRAKTVIDWLGGL